MSQEEFSAFERSKVLEELSENRDTLDKLYVFISSRFISKCQNCSTFSQQPLYLESRYV